MRTLKHDNVRVNPRPNAQTVIDQLPRWIQHHNNVHPHRTLGYRSPREYITQTYEALSSLQGAATVEDLPMARLEMFSARPLWRWLSIDPLRCFREVITLRPLQCNQRSERETPSIG